MTTRPTHLFLAVLLLLCFTPSYAALPKPAWSITEVTPQWLVTAGFTFEYTPGEPNGELIIVIPPSLDDDGKQTFIGTLLLHDELAVDVEGHQFKDRTRIILTISDKMAKHSTLSFYFRKPTEVVTEGVQLRVNIADLQKHAARTIE